ncbi:hypothetical protein [Nocardioides acrostichi]|nr:hypothetical protein [Nocardioides acrostichi]
MYAGPSRTVSVTVDGSDSGHTPGLGEVDLDAVLAFVTDPQWQQ